jgi:hypothetical protein
MRQFAALLIITALSQPLLAKGNADDQSLDLSSNAPLTKLNFYDQTRVQQEHDQKIVDALLNGQNPPIEQAPEPVDAAH